MKEKKSFWLDRKSPKFKKYNNFKPFKPYLIHRTCDRKNKV